MKKFEEFSVDLQTLLKDMQQMSFDFELWLCLLYKLMNNESYMQELTKESFTYAKGGTSICLGANTGETYPFFRAGTSLESNLIDLRKKVQYKRKPCVLYLNELKMSQLIITPRSACTLCIRNLC